MVDWQNEYNKAVIEAHELSDKLNRVSHIATALILEHGDHGKAVLTKSQLDVVVGETSGITWKANGDTVELTVDYL